MPKFSSGQRVYCTVTSGDGKKLTGQKGTVVDEQRSDGKYMVYVMGLVMALDEPDLSARDD